MPSSHHDREPSAGTEAVIVQQTTDALLQPSIFVTTQPARQGSCHHVGSGQMHGCLFSRRVRRVVATPDTQLRSCCVSPDCSASRPPRRYSMSSFRRAIPASCALREHSISRWLRRSSSRHCLGAAVQQLSTRPSHDRRLLRGALCSSDQWRAASPGDCGNSPTPSLTCMVGTVCRAVRSSCLRRRNALKYAASRPRKCCIPASQSCRDLPTEAAPILGVARV